MIIKDKMLGRLLGSRPQTKKEILEMQDSGEMIRLDYKIPQDLELANKNPGLIFRVGERVKVKGGDFKIRSIGKKMIIIEGLPGTRIVK